MEYTDLDLEIITDPFGFKKWQITDNVNGKRTIGADFNEVAKNIGLTKKEAKSLWDNFKSF